MKCKAIVGFLFALLCVQVVSLHAEPQQYVLVDQPNNLGMIKVLLHKGVEAVNLEVHGGYKVLDPKTGHKVAKGSLKKQYLLRPTLDGLVWGEAYPGTFQIALVPNESHGYFLVDGIQYSGNLYVYQIGGSLSLVNEIAIEEYVKTMLNPVVNQNMEHEVLAAMAIIERTQAYYHALLHQNKFWHVNGQELGYQGRAVCGRNNGVDRAVELTHHLVMKSNAYGIHDGFFFATYTANCAGKTAPFHLINRFEGHSYKKSIESPLAFASRNQSHWTHKLFLEDLAEKLDLDAITRFEVFRDADSGKVYGLKFESKDGNKEMSFEQFQTLLGEKKIKSSDFTAESKDNVLFLDGYGEGSGVGACLFTATEMAKRGHNAAEILGIFFPIPTSPTWISKNNFFYIQEPCFMTKALFFCSQKIIAKI